MMHDTLNATSLDAANAVTTAATAAVTAASTERPPGAQALAAAAAGTLSGSALRVSELLKSLGHDKPVVMLPETGKTSAEAAAGLGCSVAEIAKSIVFRRLSDDAAVMVVASGVNRVDEAKVAALVGPLGRADAKFIKTRIGYAIGGVCPIGHLHKTVMLIDQDLMKLDSVWAAAGHPHAVFNLTPQQLVAMTGAPVVDVALREA